MSTFSPEMTFLPRVAPYEIRDKRAGKRLNARIQRWLNGIGQLSGIYLMSKLDLFRVKRPYYGDPDEADAWCIEIVPFHRYFSTEWLDPEHEDHAVFMTVIDGLFKVMRKRFGLVPFVAKNVRRNGSIVRREYPTGANHLHFSADLFSTSVDFYKQMERFHRDLMMDYVNRPYIRWLLAQWSDDLNSECAVKREDFGPDGRLKLDAEAIWKRAVGDQTHIESRFMAHTKTSYLTFEFRFINMVESAEELWAVAWLISAWIEQIRKRQYPFNTAPYTPIEPTITLADWRAAGKLRKSHALVKNWLDSIRACSRVRSVVETLFQRNYANRLRYGKLC